MCSVCQLLLVSYNNIDDLLQRVATHNTHFAQMDYIKKYI